jgi:hypothetical protein
MDRAALNQDSTYGAPVIRLLLIVQVADPSDERAVAVFLGPFDGFVLDFEGWRGHGRHDPRRRSLQVGEDMVGMILDDVVSVGTTLWTAFRAGLDVNIRHGFFTSGEL